MDWIFTVAIMSICVSVCVVINNILLRWRLKRQTEAMRSLQSQLIAAHKKSAVAALSAGILHQLGQPITAIYGFVRMMRADMRPDHAFYKPVEMLDEQATYVKQMLENLMELVRHQQIVKTPTDVNLVIQKSLHLLKDELRIQQVACTLALDGDIPLLMADGLHLQQIFMNLTVNALEAMGDLPKEKARILEVKSSYDKDNHQAVIVFKDNGPGIAREHQPSVFNPFFTTKPTGTGLGLALCHDLVVEHGGSIRFDSDGGGTVFTLVFACQRV